MGAVTVIDEKKNFRTFKFSLLAEHGCNPDLLYRLQYAHEKLPFLLSPLVDTQEK
jgi:polo-like kinase 1